MIIGVHTPEFAFEFIPSNVWSAVKRLGIRYPVGLDNGYRTWNAYANQYWPAEYLIDRTGHVRHTHFGEGEYGETEARIRKLLAEQRVSLPGHTTAIAYQTPSTISTPEKYLGYGRLAGYAGSKMARTVSTGMSSRVGSSRTPSPTAVRGVSRLIGSLPGVMLGSACASRPSTSMSCSPAGAGSQST